MNHRGSEVHFWVWELGQRIWRQASRQAGVKSAQVRTSGDLQGGRSRIRNTEEKCIIRTIQVNVQSFDEASGRCKRRCWRRSSQGKDNGRNWYRCCYWRNQAIFDIRQGLRQGE